MPKIKMHVLFRVPHLQLEDLDSLARSLGIVQLPCLLRLLLQTQKLQQKKEAELQPCWKLPGMLMGFSPLLRFGAFYFET